MRLDITDLSVRRAGRDIVRDLDAEVAPGEVVGLLGPNGSGKSTLLKSVYRALRPCAGRITIDGTDTRTISPKVFARQTAAVVQESNMDFDFSAAEVVEMGRTPHPGAGNRARDRAIVVDALARVGATHLAGRSFPTLSGGEKQRVLLARALAQEPRLLVLDEPTNHLDVHFQLELMDLVTSLGVTVLAALHDLNIAAEYCDRLYLIADGSIVASGRPDEVLTPETVGSTFGVQAVQVPHPVTGATQLMFVTAARATACHHHPPDAPDPESADDTAARSLSQSPPLSRSSS